MNVSIPSKRVYSSARRSEAAQATHESILVAAKSLFGRNGIDKVKISDIGDQAGVAASTVYAIFKSKDGLLRALFEQSLFGPRFQQAQNLLAGIADPVKLVELTAHVSRAIYEAESDDLGLIRHASGFSPALRRMEQEFEHLRFTMQEERLRMLDTAGRLRSTLTVEEARHIMWTLTSRDVYRMLVKDGAWTADRYQDWLSQTLSEALVE
jgi:AcrR family transcriptional regulator